MLTSSIGRKHLQLLFPAQFLSTVELNISGIAGRTARAQQTRITRDHLRQMIEVKPKTPKTNKDNQRKYEGMMKKRNILLGVRLLITCVFGVKSGNQLVS